MKFIKISVVICFFIFPIYCMSQTTFGISTGISKIVDGSYYASYYENFIRINVNEIILEPVLSFTSSANFDVGNEYNWHNFSYLVSGVNLLYTPIKKKRFSFMYGIGLNFRLRNETIPMYWKYIIDEEGKEQLSDIKYKNYSNIDWGSSTKLLFDYKIEEKVSTGVTINFSTYRKGASSLCSAIFFAYNF